MTVLLGEAVTLTLTTTDGSGTPTVVVTEPDGSTTSPVVAGSGPWTATFTADQPGRHTILWTRGTALVADILDVWPTTPRFLISVDDALAALRAKLAVAQAEAREELPLYIAAATWVVENIVGTVLPASKSCRRDGGRNAVVLPHRGVDVTQVTVSGTVLAATSYVVDTDAGIVYAGSDGLGCFRAGRVNVEVAYTVGSAVIPENVRLAAREEVRFLWQIGHQGARPVGDTADVTPWAAEGFAVPRRVVELLQPHARSDGFA